MFSQRIGSYSISSSRVASYDQHLEHRFSKLDGEEVHNWQAFTIKVDSLLCFDAWDKLGHIYHRSLTASNCRKKSSGLSSILSESAWTSTIGLRFWALSREACARFCPWAVTGTRNWARHDSSDTYKTHKLGWNIWLSEDCCTLIFSQATEGSHHINALMWTDSAFVVQSSYGICITVLRMKAGKEPTWPSEEYLLVIQQGESFNPS